MENKELEYYKSLDDSTYGFTNGRVYCLVREPDENIGTIGYFIGDYGEKHNITAAYLENYFDKVEYPALYIVESIYKDGTIKQLPFRTIGHARNWIYRIMAEETDDINHVSCKTLQPYTVRLIADMLDNIV